MAFNWFRKKGQPDDPILATLNLDAPSFVRFVKGLLCESEPGASTMCVVALRNLEPIMIFAKDWAEREPKKHVPNGIDEFIRLLSEENPKDEISSRRQWWFQYALLVKRATILAEHNVAFHDDVAAIWVRLAEGGKYLKRLLEHNVIWDDNEKLWFSEFKSEKDGASYVLNLMSPKWIRENKQIQDYAFANDFFVFGSF